MLVGEGGKPQVVHEARDQRFREFNTNTIPRHVALGLLYKCTLYVIVLRYVALDIMTSSQTVLPL
jgi:hypothetical protein